MNASLSTYEVAPPVPAAPVDLLHGDDRWAGDVLAVGRVRPSVPRRPRNRQLAAVAFVDISDSTNQLLAHGDHGWSSLLAELHVAGDRTITEHQGRIVKTLGDGLLATFPTASDAIAALRAIRTGAARRDLTVRGGIHTAEIEVLGTDITGVGVHIAARVEALAEPGELWVTSTVHDVVAGSRVQLDDRGEHELKGFDVPFHLYAVR